MNPVDDAVDAPTGATSAGGTSTRPRRWLLPGIAVGVVVAGLVVAGVVSLSTALSGGLFAGMLLMHVGGHGMHGGHGGGGHGGHGGQDERTTDARTRGEGAPGASRRSDLAPTPEGAASDAPRGERHDDARRDSHAGH